MWLSRSTFVVATSAALVLTGCAADDPVLLRDGVSVGVESSDLHDGDGPIDDDRYDDVERGALLYDDAEDPDEIVYVGEALEQCIARGDVDPDGVVQHRSDLAGGGSLVVHYEPVGNDLVDVDLTTEPGAAVISWDADGEGAWQFTDGVLIAETVARAVEGTQQFVVRLVVDWDDDVADCPSTQEPVTEIEGGGSFLELPGARIDAVSVCEEPAGTWTMLLEDGTVFTVTGDADGTGGSATLELTSGEDRDVDVVSYRASEPDDEDGVDDGVIDGTVTYVEPSTGDTVEAAFRIERAAAAGCDP